MSGVELSEYCFSIFFEDRHCLLTGLTVGNESDGATTVYPMVIYV